MKPKGATEHEDGLLEYLEDIIGTDRFKKPIAEAMAAFEALNEERQEKLNRVKLVEGDVSALQGGKEEAELFLREENSLVRVKNRVWQIKQRTSTVKLERAKAESVSFSWCDWLIPA